jgi:hypothetical protein
MGGDGAGKLNDDGRGDGYPDREPGGPRKVSIAAHPAPWGQRPKPQGPTVAQLLANRSRKMRGLEALSLGLGSLEASGPR